MSITWSEGGWRDADFDQVSGGVCRNGVASGAGSNAAVFASEKSSEVHTGAVVCHTCSERLFPDGLPADYPDAFGMVGPEGSARVDQNATLFDTLLRRKANAQKRGFGKLLAETVSIARSRSLMRECVSTCAIDSTGYEAGHTSSYYGRRCGLKKRRFPKLTTVCDTRSYLYLSAVADRGPLPDDIEFKEAVREAYALQPFREILGDAGYDAEHHHWYVTHYLDARSVIPATRGRPTKSGKPPTGRYRRLMMLRFPRKKYGKRWHIESCFSQDKRVFGSQLHPHNYWSQCRALLLRVLVHNIAILLSLFHLFNRAEAFPFRIEHQWRSCALAGLHMGQC